MKLREIIEKLDKSEKNSSWIDINELANSEFDIFSWVSKEPDKLKAYYFLKWYCTDSYVGGRVYFLDDKPIAITWQGGRKASQDFQWISKEVFKETRDYILTLTEEDIKIENIDLVDLDTEYNDGYPVEYSSQLLTNKLIYKSTGEYIDVIEKYDGMDKIKDWGNVKVQFKSGTNSLISMKEILVPYEVIDKSKK